MVSANLAGTHDNTIGTLVATNHTTAASSTVSEQGVYLIHRIEARQWQPSDDAVGYIHTQLCRLWLVPTELRLRPPANRPRGTGIPTSKHKARVTLDRKPPAHHSYPRPRHHPETTLPPNTTVPSPPPPPFPKAPLTAPSPESTDQSAMPIPTPTITRKPPTHPQPLLAIHRHLATQQGLPK